MFDDYVPLPTLGQQQAKLAEVIEATIFIDCAATGKRRSFHLPQKVFESMRMER
ncbi:MAG: hypothetical protein ACJ8CR_26955 [Roseiflexaceae bacterium]